MILLRERINNVFLHYLPPDPTKEEHKILNQVAVTIYQLFPDPKDKFIIAMVFEHGYGKNETARALGCSYMALYNREKKIRAKLEGKFESNLKKEEEKIAEVNKTT